MMRIDITKNIQIYLILLIGFLLQGCVQPISIPTTIPNAPGQPWYSAYQTGHSLVGKIWSPKEEKFVTLDELVAHAGSHKFVLLGELHDNVDHHQTQAWFVSEMARRGRRMGVAFEMIAENAQTPLDAYLQQEGARAESVGTVIGWNKTGWLDWRMYQPIVAAAMEAGFPIRAGSFSKEKIRRIVREGYSVFELKELFELNLDQKFPPEVTDIVKDSIRVSHMGALPEQMEEAMVNMQMAKDARMALAMIKVAQKDQIDGAILIAGKGHVRNDIGVPYQIERMANSSDVATIGFFEVADGLNEPEEYSVLMNGAHQLPFDYVWFTPQHKDRSNTGKHLRQIKKAVEKHESGE